MTKGNAIRGYRLQDGRKNGKAPWPKALDIHNKGVDFEWSQLLYHSFSFSFSFSFGGGGIIGEFEKSWEIGIRRWMESRKS